MRAAGKAVLGLLFCACAGGGGNGNGTPDAGSEPQITVTLVSPASPIRVTTTLVLRWSTNLAPQTSDVMIDGQVVVTVLSVVSTSVSTAALADGSHALEIRVARGTNQATTGMIPFTVDHTPPTLEILSPPFFAEMVGNHVPARFRFSEPVVIDPSAVPFYVAPSGGSGPTLPVPGTLELEADQVTYRFTPDGGWAQVPWPFEPRGVYTGLTLSNVHDLAGNPLVEPDWYFYVSGWQILGGQVPAPLDSWVDIASSPGGRLVMAHHRPDFVPELLELDAGVWTAFPLPPALDGGELGPVSMALDGETLHAASATYFPSRPVTLQLHKWTDGGWEELATGSLTDIGDFTLTVAPDTTGFLNSRVGAGMSFAVLRADGGTWEQLGANIASTFEASGFPVRPVLTSDLNSVPWIAVLENSPGGTVAQVRRWSGTSWDAVGPGIGGLTPEELPRLSVDSSERPVVSYRMTDPGTGFIRIQVVRLESGVWVPMGSALQGKSDPPLNLEVGVFLRHAMTMRDGDRPVLAFTTGNAGAYGLAVCEWLGTDWSCFANEAQDFGVYGPPAVTVWNGDSVPGILTSFLVDGGFVNGTGVIVPNR